MEAWLSGLRHRFRKAACGKPYQGFESSRFRNDTNKYQPKLVFVCIVTVRSEGFERRRKRKIFNFSIFRAATNDTYYFLSAKHEKK